MKKGKLLIFVLVIILVVFPVFKKVKSEKIKNQEYIYVTVKSGDTVWKIAKKHNINKKDIRKLVYEIREINKLDTLIIHPGQLIKVPIE
ncbi:Cell division suppressor protein YneA [Caloramator mitchellensis]|uniref:Cell division suppressor protein YneA n=1 Tax=Caloramator mitchellensis TaxID=908809 RepID=A0A0R3K198_CALMK|nr:LysM peptidoglycan-binding domain-containing protein [Caloramator mitchellensis]KRQ87020.1 Cell division suppressor protein YneA [Caloramator mitchellensis]